MDSQKTEQAPSGAWGQMLTAIKQAFQVSQLQSIQAQQQRAAQLAEQQRLMYQQPVTVRLNAQQLQYIYEQLNTRPYSNSADVMLNQEQMARVVTWFLEQAWTNGDIQTFQNLRNKMVPLGLGFNLDYLRQLHKDLFDSFIHGHNPGLTYADGTPPNGLLVLNGHGFGFCYRISANSQTTQKRYREDFYGFIATAQGQALIRKYGLYYKEIVFNSTAGNMVIYFV